MTNLVFPLVSKILSLCYREFLFHESRRKGGAKSSSLLFLCHFGKLPFSLSRHFTQKAAAFKPL